MSICTRMLALALVVSWAGAGLAGDAYYDIPIRDLKLVEGSLPLRKDDQRYRPFSEYARVEMMQPYAALDAAGEVYVAGRSDPSDPWFSPGWDAVPPAGTSAEEQQGATPSRGTRVLVRAAEGKDVTGRLFVPNADLTGMVVLKFAIPATSAKPEAKRQFGWAKAAYYQRLMDREIPGGAWFRHQIRLVRSEMKSAGGKVEELPAARMGRRRWRSGSPDEFTHTYELFTGGRAMSENLQLDRALPPRSASDKPVKIESLSGITIKEIDWKPLIKDAQPKLDPLARSIPDDQLAVFLPSFQAAIEVSDETSQHDTPVLRLAQPRSENAGVVERYQRQLGLSLSAVARLLGPTFAKSVALTSSDPFFPTGTDVAVLFESPQPDALESLLLAKIALAAAEVAEAKPVNGEIGGLQYRGFLSPDRRMSSYVAQLEGAVVVANSTYQLGRLAAVGKGEAKSVADLPEYIFFRSRYRLEEPEETALLFLSDATIRRWCGPKWRIAGSRRARALAVLTELQASQLDSLVKQTVKPGPLHTDLPLLGGGELTLGPAGVASSTLGTLEFMTPIAEIPLEEVTKAEADAYGAWRDGYQRNWSWAFDPVALRIGLGKSELSADMTVMPLIVGSEYNEFIAIAQGGKFEPTDGDIHDALAQFILAINRQSPLFRQGESFVSTMGQAVSIGWIGKWVNIFADDDPFWKDLAAVKLDDMERYLQENAGRIPVAVRIDSSNPLRLAAFLTGLRAFSEQTAPGLVMWESLKYQDQSYVRISPVKGKNTVLRELENLAIHYTTVDNALTVTLSEKVLQGVIDRSLARQKAQAEGKEKPQPVAPWLGSSVALRVDRKILEVVSVAQRQHYEASMQARCWGNLPILNEWKRLYPDRDPLQVHRDVWGVELLCPGGGQYVWNEQYQTMESTVYGHPGEPKEGPPAPPVLSTFATGSFGLTFENQGLRAQAVLQRPVETRNQ